MEIRYRREISHNYLIIKTDGLGEDYEMRMAEENCVGGFLPLLIKESEGGKEFYYEKSNYSSLMHGSRFIHQYGIWHNCFC